MQPTNPPPPAPQEQSPHRRNVQLRQIDGQVRVPITGVALVPRYRCRPCLDPPEAAVRDGRQRSTAVGHRSHDAALAPLASSLTVLPSSRVCAPWSALGPHGTRKRWSSVGTSGHGRRVRIAGHRPSTATTSDGAAALDRVRTPHPCCRAPCWGLAQQGSCRPGRASPIARAGARCRQVRGAAVLTGRAISVPIPSPTAPVRHGQPRTLLTA
jgi:hypothetical protein